MPIDPKVRAMLDRMASSGTPPLDTLSPVQARKVFLNMRSTKGEPEPVGEVMDRAVPGSFGDIPIRIYTPEVDGPYPALVYYHGGGWVIGNLDSHDGICRSLTNLAKCAVISVDYRLAPEHPFPAAVEDSYVAAQWIFEHAAELNIDPSRIAVGGDSAGGNLAAVVAFLAKERGTPKLIHQLLIYPITSLSFDTVSYAKNGEGYFLTRDLMVWFSEHYIKNPEDAENPLAAPFLIEDLQGLPPALVITAEFDPLRDEGEAYATRLREADVSVIYTCYDGMIHGFVGTTGILDQGKKALRQAADCLKLVFGK
jgi:acetyl esterase